MSKPKNIIGLKFQQSSLSSKRKVPAELTALLDCLPDEPADVFTILSEYHTFAGYKSVPESTDSNLIKLLDKAVRLKFVKTINVYEAPKPKCAYRDDTLAIKANYKKEGEV